ncbi:sensor histidine kinase [Methylocystis bryophila]|nr:ATP-binding protein [Methylocystis bryophila]
MDPTRKSADAQSRHLSNHTDPLAAKPTGGHDPLSTCIKSHDERHAERDRIIELETINEQLSQFAWIAAHDLQEPMRKIMAFATLLDQGIATGNHADVERAKNAILKSASAASELVNEILIYARVSNIQLEHDVLDLQEQMRLALDDISQSGAETRAEIHLSIPPTPFKADPSQFARLMQNILSNAIKYRKPDRPPKITISTSRSDKNIILAISDDGIGFEQEFAEIIFYPFKRLHSKSKYPGSGMGLAICKSICDREGWDISVRSQPQEGTTFYISIPALEAPAPSLSESDEAKT